MLVLSRKANQEIMIGDHIQLTILKVKGNTVRIGIQAPEQIRIIRGELKETVGQFREPVAAEDQELTTVQISRHRKKTGKSVRVFSEEPQDKNADNDSTRAQSTVEGVIGFVPPLDDITIS